ncbi:MAG: PTS sugar transporter subunit IIB [bacterium]|nr:PTS sugar transporter subunit IIB [bacterium]
MRIVSLSRHMDAERKCFSLFLCACAVNYSAIRNPQSAIRNMMGLILVRIDDRLIHGQVIVGWGRAISAERVVVANDWISTDRKRKLLFEMAVPPQMEVAILPVKEAADKIKAHAFEDKRTILLLSNPKDTWRLVEEGAKLKSINVGGMRAYPDRKQVLSSLWVSAEEVEIFRKMAELGIELEGRAVPTDHRINIMDYLK